MNVMSMTNMNKYKFIHPELLTHPNIPKPLHGVNPRSVLGKDWWDEKRVAAYAENNFCCHACGTHKSKAKFHQWLEGHEAYIIDYPRGEIRLEKIVALCHSCHNYIHNGRLKHLLDKGDVTKEKYDAIMKHGDSLLKKAGLARRAGYDGEVADWNKWRLVIDDKKYKPKYNSYNEWLVAYR